MPEPPLPVVEGLALAAGQARNRERARLAAILHDSICQSLNVVGIELDLIAMDFSHVPQLAERLAAVRASLETSFEQVRSLSYDVMPSPAARLGLKVALERLAALHPCVTITAAESGPALDTARAAAFYAIAELSIEESLRRCQDARISVELDGSRLTVSTNAPATASDDLAWLLAHTRMTLAARSAGLSLFVSPADASQDTMIQISAER
ncbi:MAG: hypothetical protein FJW20_09790 [Acidimicrobiia bacterium]|nr:hypothetical protein [Acidimicrobiia bacterium]